MANDGFAGTAVLIEIMKYISTIKPFYSYRLIIAPEHLGSVFYLKSLKKKIYLKSYLEFLKKCQAQKEK